MRLAVLLSTVLLIPGTECNSLKIKPQRYALYVYTDDLARALEQVK